MELTELTEWVFWISVGFSFYIQIGYLLMLKFLSILYSKPSRKEKQYSPFISIIIAAYNEEKIISKKIENTLQLDYPCEKMEIIVFSDASSDRTDEIVRRYADKGVQLIRVEGRKGKSYCQNVAVERSKGEILLFTDADAFLQPDVIRKIVRHFADPTVGCVAGKVCYVDASGESWYQRYETKLFELESRVSSPTGAFGPLYALRRDLFEPIPADTQEDLVRPLLVVYQHRRIVFEPEAVAWLQSTASVESEARRRQRMVARAVYSILYYPPMRALLNPAKYGFFALQMWSHRILRWGHGIFLAIALLTNGLLITKSSLYWWLSLMQFGFYMTALIGYLIESRNKKFTHFLIHFAYYYLTAQVAMLHGLWHGIKGKSFTTWQPIR